MAPLPSGLRSGSLSPVTAPPPLGTLPCRAGDRPRAAAHCIRAPGRHRPWRAVLPPKPRSLCARRGPRLRPRRALPGEDSGTKSDFQTGRRAASFGGGFPVSPHVLLFNQIFSLLWPTLSLVPRISAASFLHVDVPVWVRDLLPSLPAAACAPGVVSALLRRPCGGWDSGSDGLCAEPTAGAPGGPRLCSRGTQCLQGPVMWERRPPHSPGPPCRTDPWTSTPEVPPGPPRYCCDLRPRLAILIRGPAGAPRPRPSPARGSVVKLPLAPKAFLGFNTHTRNEVRAAASPRP